MNHRRPSTRPDAAPWRPHSGSVNGLLATGGHHADGEFVDHPNERHRHRAAMLPSEPPTTSWQPVVAHRAAHQTVHIGRVRDQVPNGNAPAGGSGQNEQRGGRGRRPGRALVVGLLLAAATGVGVVVAALAVAATPVPASGVSGLDRPAISLPVTDGARSTGEAISTRPPLSAGADDPAGPVPDPASSVPGPFLPTDQGAFDPPAKVSTLAPGEAGFGWPSSAFGSAP